MTDPTIEQCLIKDSFGDKTEIVSVQQQIEQYVYSTDDNISN